MKPNSIEDFLPLIEMDTTQLKIFTHNVAKRPKGVPHPILYFSEKLNVRNFFKTRDHRKSFFQKKEVSKEKVLSVF